MNAVCVAKRADVAPGRGKLVNAGERELALFNVDGKYYALDNECAHLGGPLSEGFLRDCRVTCPWHNWEYDVTTGKEVLHGKKSVRAYPTHVEGEDVYVVIEGAA